jgi:molecular chaperone DnaK (HSP70)
MQSLIELLRSLLPIVGIPSFDSQRFALMHTRQPYSGTHRRLVLGIDLGTTYSGVSYSILDPGQVPEIKGVNRSVTHTSPHVFPQHFASFLLIFDRYPAQEQVGGDCKIPSIAYYDAAGRPRAFGAEALQEHIIEQAEDEQWMKVEWQFFYSS